MHICLVCTEKLPVPPIRGGAIQMYIASLLPMLAQMHEVTVVCRTDPALPEQETNGRIRYVRLPASQGADAYYQHVTQFLRTQRFDLIEIFNRPAYIAQLSSAVGDTRLILSVHNDMFNLDRISPQAARLVLARVEAVVTISDYVRQRIDHLHPGFAAKLRTIRSGVDTRLFCPWWEAGARRHAIRQRLGLAGRPVVLHVSRFSPKKGNHLVLAAMRRVRLAHPSARLLVVGSRWYGSDQPDHYTCTLQRMAARLGETVQFTGFVPPDQLPELFLVGDLFVCASQWLEPLARVHYEAMAAGLPIITTDRGGNGEVIEEEGNGLIARPHDSPAAFANLITRLLSDPEHRERLGRCGRQLAEERYRWDRVAQELLCVIEGR